MGWHRMRYVTQGGSIYCKRVEQTVRERIAWGWGHSKKHDFPPSFAGRTMVFLYPFLRRKEGIRMTMMKREVNSIWSRVRSDVDIDDLIFDYEGTHAREDESCSDRWWGIRPRRSAVWRNKRRSRKINSAASFFIARTAGKKRLIIPNGVLALLRKLY